MAKPLRLALGALIIQTKYQYSDRELVEQLMENPYYQYFIGLPGYQEEPPIDASTVVLFRKRLKMDVIMEANEYMLDAFHEDGNHDKKDDDDPPNPPGGGTGNKELEGYMENGYAPTANERLTIVDDGSGVCHGGEEYIKRVVVPKLPFEFLQRLYL